MLPFLLPAAAGLGLTTMAGVSPLVAGLITGAATGAVTGDWEKALLGGLGGFGAAGLGGALAGAGGAGAAGAAGAAPMATLGTGTAGMTTGQLASAATGTGAGLTTAGAAPLATSIAPAAGAASTAPTFAQMGQGIKALMQPGAFKTGGVGQTFLKEAMMPGVALASSAMGGSMMDAQQDALKSAEEREEEKRQRGMATQAFMSRTALPQYRVGVPYTAAQGGLVSLANGGMVPDNNKTLIGYSASGEPVYADASMTMRGAGMESPFAYQDPEVLSAQRRGRMPVGTTTTTPGEGPSMEQLSAMRVGRSPQYQEFMRQLQKGAGAPAASQASGYTGGRYTSEIPEEEMKMAGGGYLGGGAVPGDGMSDSVPAAIDGNTPAALSSGEFVMPADVVSGLGNGSSEAGAQQLYAMMDRIRKSRTGTTEQAPAINPNRMMVA